MMEENKNNGFSQNETGQGVPRTYGEESQMYAERGYNRPQNETGQPQNGMGQPVNGATQSGYGQPVNGAQPGYGQPQNGMGQPGYGQPQNGMGQPGYNQPQNGMGQPGYGQPQNGMGQPGYNQPQNGMGQPQNGMGQPGYGQPQNGMGQPGYNQPQNGMGQPGGPNQFQGGIPPQQPGYGQSYGGGYMNQQPVHGEVKNIFCYILLVVMPLRILLGFFMMNDLFGNMDYDSIVNGNYMLNIMGSGYMVITTITNLLSVAFLIFVILDIVMVYRGNYKITGLILFAIFLNPGYYLWRAHLLGQKKTVPVIYTVCYALLMVFYFIFTFIKVFQAIGDMMYYMY